MSAKLYSFPGDFRAFKAQIAAQYNGVKLDRPAFTQGVDNVKPEFLAKSPAGKVPLLETAHGNIFESNAIARYIARIRRDTELLGKSFFESAQVEQWLDFASHDVEVPVTLWVYPVMGLLEFKQEVYNTAVENLNKALAVLEKHLLLQTYLVGESITLADIVLVSALHYPFKLVLDEAKRAAYPNVQRWYLTCANQPAFKAVLGEVVLATEELKAGAGAAALAAPVEAKKEKKEKAPKAEKKAEEPKPKEEKKKAKKEEDDDGADDMAAFKEVKKDDPFAVLPPTTMVLDEWKRTYSNSKQDYYASMPWLWEHLDSNGWSLFKAEYKFNDENKVDWQTSNLIGGFIQRCDEIRKYAFGTLAVLGAEAPFQVAGVWLLRGGEPELKHLLEANPDAEYYNWIKLDPKSEADRQLTADYWCALEKIDGKPIYDSKVFK